MGPFEFSDDHDARFLPRQQPPLSFDNHWTLHCFYRIAEMRDTCPDGWYTIARNAIYAEGYGSCHDTLRGLGLDADA